MKLVKSRFKSRFKVFTNKKVECGIDIPGIGPCEEPKRGHEVDKHGRLVHRKGPCSWNGGLLIEVDGL